MSFNQVVCTDLKYHVHNEAWILHMTESVTKCSASCLIIRKNYNAIVQGIYLKWIAYFSAPKKLRVNSLIINTKR